MPRIVSEMDYILANRSQLGQDIILLDRCASKIRPKVDERRQSPSRQAFQPLKCRGWWISNERKKESILWLSGRCLIQDLERIVIMMSFAVVRNCKIVSKRVYDDDDCFIKCLRMPASIERISEAVLLSIERWSGTF